MTSVPRLGAVVILMQTLMACASYEKEDHYIEKQAIETCKLERHCYLAFYVDEYSDMEDCIDEKIDFNDDFSDLADDAGCDYEPDEAATCIDSIRRAAKTSDDNDLEDAIDDCTDVYDCR